MQAALRPQHLWQEPEVQNLEERIWLPGRVSWTPVPPRLGAAESGAPQGGWREVGAAERGDQEPGADGGRRSPGAGVRLARTVARGGSLWTGEGRGEVLGMALWTWGLPTAGTTSVRRVQVRGRGQRREAEAVLRRAVEMATQNQEKQ